LRPRAAVATLGLIAASIVAAPALSATSADQKLADRYAPVLAF
jgi:hypothetical protein